MSVSPDEDEEEENGDEEGDQDEGDGAVILEDEEEGEEAAEADSMTISEVKEEELKPEVDENGVVVNVEDNVPETGLKTFRQIFRYVSYAFLSAYVVVVLGDLCSPAEPLAGIVPDMLHCVGVTYNEGEIMCPHIWSTD